MALYKEITSDSGAVATYHKITLFKDDRINKIAYVELASFKDESCKTMKPLSVLNLVFELNAELPYQFDPANLDVEGMNHIKKAYDIIKTMSEFTGATDV